MSGMWRCARKTKARAEGWRRGSDIDGMKPQNTWQGASTLNTASTSVDRPEIAVKGGVM